MLHQTIIIPSTRYISYILPCLATHRISNKTAAEIVQLRTGVRHVKPWRECTGGDGSKNLMRTSNIGMCDRGGDYS
jgi:hypothetical protein